MHIKIFHTRNDKILRRVEMAKRKNEWTEKRIEKYIREGRDMGKEVIINLG